MPRWEHRVVALTLAALAVVMLSGASSIWPSSVTAHAQAAGQGSLPGVPPPTTLAPAPAPVEEPPAAPAQPPPPTDAVAVAVSAPAPLVDDSGSNVLHVTVEHAARVLGVTVRYPTAPGRYPLVVFAHGFGASAATYAALEGALAAAGFVVAAPDFPHSSSASTSWLDRGDVVNQAGDVSAVIDFLYDPGRAPAELSAVIAPGPVGVVGHSDGGITAAAVAYNSEVADPRVGAAAVLSGALVMYGGSWFTTQSPPLLAVHGDADEVNPYWSSRQIFDEAAGAKWFVTVLGGSHGGPFTTWPVVRRVAALAADFLHASLQGDGAARARIDDDANTDGLALTAVG